MERRRYLALVGATGLAGCASIRGGSGGIGGSGSDGSSGSGSGGGSGGETPTPAPPSARQLADSTTYRTPDGWTLRIQTVRVQRGAFPRTQSGDDVVVPSDRQFLRVRVTTAGAGAPPAEDVSLVASTDGSRPFSPDDTLVEIESQDQEGTLRAVPVPYTVAADTVEVVWTGSGDPVRWTVPGGLVGALARPVGFSVESFLVSGGEGTPPDDPQVGEGGDVPIDITVLNEGSRADWFLAELGVATEGDARNIQAKIGAGETRTISRTLTARFVGSQSLTINLDWGNGTRTLSVDRA